MNTAKLQVDNLNSSYDGIPILENITLELQDEEFVALLGPSGAGKSTLLKALASQIDIDEGTVRVDGQILTAESRARSEHFAYMPQEDLLFPWASVWDNVTLYDRLHPHGEGHSTETVYDLISRFGLGGYEHELPSKLSGGMRQRAAFLRTALCPADILLLDEPFGALDVITRGTMQDWLLNIRRVLKRTILLVTHDLEEAIYLADRILILHGRPSSIRKIIEIPTPPEERDREWLFAQAEHKSEIYHLLKNAEAAWPGGDDEVL